MKKPFLVLFSLFGLLSCSTSFSRFEKEIVSSSFVDLEGEGYKKVSSFSPLESQDEEIDTNLLSNVIGSSSFKTLPSLGEQKLLVVPVKFSDYGEEEEKKVDLINKAFFGSKENNQYYSVSEYYYLSSGGRLLIKGDVTPFYKCSYSLSRLNSLYGSNNTKNALSLIYKEAIEWLKETKPSLYDSYYYLYKEDIPIYFVYDAPYSGMSDSKADRKSMMWAFTINDPAPVCWSSYYMGYPNKDKMDAHTYIHETGHLLGLSDYYDTSSNVPNRISPLGRMDMMDCSLGDHNCFSKMILGWSSPYFVTSTTKIRLHQSSGNNECIIIPIDSGFNPYGRYVLLEFYSPTYLNYLDAFNRNGLSLFPKAGIRTYLVDARVAIYEGVSKLGIVSKAVSSKGKRLGFNNDNSSSSFLIQNIDKSLNSLTLPPFYIASSENKIEEENGNKCRYSSTLFYEGEGMDSSFSGLEELGYSFKVTSLTSSYAEISIYKA